MSPLRSPRGCQSSPGEKGSFHQGDNTMGQRHSLSLPSERVPAAEAAFGSWIYRDLKPATPSSRHFTHAHLSTVKLSFPFSLRLGIKKILRLEQTSLPGIPLIHLSSTSSPLIISNWSFCANLKFWSTLGHVIPTVLHSC